MGNRSNHIYTAYTRIWAVVLYKFTAFYLKSIIPLPFRQPLPSACPSATPFIPSRAASQLVWDCQEGPNPHSLLPSSPRPSLPLLHLVPLITPSGLPHLLPIAPTGEYEPPWASSSSPMILEMVYAAPLCFFCPSWPSCQLVCLPHVFLAQLRPVGCQASRQSRLSP